ncbi:DUF2752 domain-containing protein [Tannerella serpentiformis]|uniref:DUF2752 domain-containing protein n=1 Tax=Tannerella serpentiformis TaxID=712710 RepID=UPI000840A1B5|nr:DUF2752 domain-containing protein [Tannerella serpentiformis]AOH40557.1 DUF2752 domain-containing protein [Tannerella serpentiformis]AVV54457.1 DUF2752 domain-containing protein [Tannerella serpentiformis]
MPHPTRRRLLILSLPLLLIALTIIYYRVSPTTSVFFPKCAFLLLTGLKCPGCGSQRAVHALLHADLASAFAHNALLVLSLPYLALLIGARLYVYLHPASSLRSTLESPLAIRTYFVITIAFWIARNVFGF